jgi:hypothetical protein
LHETSTLNPKRGSALANASVRARPRSRGFSIAAGQAKQRDHAEFAVDDPGRFRHAGLTGSIRRDAAMAGSVWLASSARAVDFELGKAGPPGPAQRMTSLRPPAGC